MRVVFTLLLLLVLAPFAQAQSADAIVGEWWSEDQQGRIEIYKCGEGFCGKIAWLKQQEDTGNVLTDANNPDPQKRVQPLIGLVILRGLSYKGNGRWDDGKVYDPESGNDYNVRLLLEDTDTLDLRGYVLMPLLGRSSTWKRVRGARAQ